MGQALPRGFAGPNLLAMILFEKFGQAPAAQPADERYRREGIDLGVSRLTDQVGVVRRLERPPA
jgi:transposase